MFMLGTVELPVTTDVGGSISAGIMLLASYFGIVIGSYIAFVAVRKGLKWASKAMG